MRRAIPAPVRHVEAERTQPGRSHRDEQGSLALAACFQVGQTGGNEIVAGQIAGDRDHALMVRSAGSAPGPKRDPRGSQTWDRLAARYGAQERFEMRAVDAALRVAAVESGERIIDLATGTGLVLRRLAGHARRPREAIGVDRSPGMLARGGALPPGWSTLLADAQDVPLPDGWADVITCTYALGLLPPAERAGLLAEARRLLRPHSTSRLVLVTMWAGERGALGPLVRRALAIAALARPAAWGGLGPLDPTTDLVAAGFAVTRRVAVPRRGYPSLVVEARPVDQGASR